MRRADLQQGVALLTALLSSPLPPSPQPRWHPPPPSPCAAPHSCRIPNKPTGTAQVSSPGRCHCCRAAGQPARFAGRRLAQPVIGLPVDRGTLSGRIEDLQGRFNLNNLGRLIPSLIWISSSDWWSSCRDRSRHGAQHRAGDSGLAGSDSDIYSGGGRRMRFIWRLIRVPGFQPVVHQHQRADGGEGDDRGAL